MHRQAPRHRTDPDARVTRRSALAARLVVAAVAVATGAAVTVGPASAHEFDGPIPMTTVVPAADSGPTGAIQELDTSDAFGAMLADAHRRAAEARRAELARERAERRAREIRLARKQAAKRAAEVRASRASLRSTVVRPIAGGYRLTARFDDGGSLWGSGSHTGLDFACPTGTSVHVVADGVVIKAGYDGSYGNRVEVQHADGTVTTYNHMSAILVHGGRVHAGEIIGRVGSTGNTTGAHLHFEVMRGGGYVDPETWLRARFVAY